MRRLSRKKALSLVKELDAFPKVSESYVETSASGGTGRRLLSLPSALFFFPSSSSFYKGGREQTVRCVTVSSSVSLIAFGAMALLAFLEFFVYRDTWMKYDYEVDKDFSR